MRKNKKIIAVTAAVLIDTLRRQEYLLRKIAMNQKELLDQINAANAKTEKIIGEVRALKTAVENAANVPQEIVDAVNRLTGSLDDADALNPDAPATAADTTAAEAATELAAV